MRDDFVLGETVIAAMRLAATETPTGQPLTTGRVLSALTRVDMTNDWQRIWLYTGEPQLLGLVAEPDPVDASPREAQRWDGVRLSDALADAFALLWRICRAYRLLPAPSGAMALALLADPASGATRALLRPGGLSQAKLLELVQSDLLHTTLNGVGDLIAADAGAPSVAAVPSSPRARGGPLVALPARRGSRWSLVAWRAVACLALALTAMAIFWNRQVLPSAASPVLPPYSVPTIAHQMLTTADLPAVGEGGWLQMQDGPPNTGLFAGTGRFRGDVRETYFAGAWQRTWVAVDAGAVFQEAAYVARTRAAAVAFMPTECAPARQTPLPGATVAGYQEQKPGFAEACALALRGRTLLVFSVVAQGNAARTVPWQLLAVAVQRQVPRVPATATDLPLEDFLATDTMTELNSLLMLVVVAIPLLLGLVTVLRDRSAWRRLRSRMSLSWLVRNTAVATFRVDRVVSVREARLAGLALVRVAVVVWSIRLSEHGHLSLPQTGGVVAATVAGILGVEWLIRRLTTPGAWRPAIFSGRRLVIGVVSLLLSAGIAGAGVLLVVAGIVLASVDTGTDGVSDYVSGRIGIGLPVFGGVLIVVALVPFMLARRLGMRALQDEAKKERSADEERHPVLMLRSFTDDRRLLRARRLGRASIVERLCLRRFERFEEVAAGALAVHGPVLTLSDPNQKLPPPLGAERRSFPNDKWMKPVSDLISAAPLISVTVGRSVSLQWEIGEIRGARALDRTIFLLPPTSKPEQRRRLTVLADGLGIDGALLNATRPDWDVLAVVFPAENAADAIPVVITGTAPDDVGYEAAIGAWALTVTGDRRVFPADLRRLSADLSSYAASAAVVSAADTLADPARRPPVPTDPRRLIHQGKAPVYKPWSRRLASLKFLPWLLPVCIIPAAIRVIGANEGPSQTINAPYAVTALAGDQASQALYAVLDGHLIGQVNFSDPSASRFANVRDYVDSVAVRGSDAVYTSALAGHVGLVNLRTDRILWVRSLPPGVLSPVLVDGRVVVTSPATSQVIELSAVNGRVLARKTLQGTAYNVTAAGKTLYVTLARNNAVAELNADTLDVVKTVPVPAGPRGIFATGSQVWVQCELDHELVAIGVPALHPVWLSVQGASISGNAGLLAVQGMEWVSVLTPDGRLTRTPLFQTDPESLVARQDGAVIVGYSNGEIDIYGPKKS